MDNLSDIIVADRYYVFGGGYLREFGGLGNSDRGSIFAGFRVS